MTTEEFNNLWLPAIRLIARAEVQLGCAAEREANPKLAELFSTLSKDCNSFINEATKVHYDFHTN
jgi:hypothetical protein